MNFAVEYHGEIEKCGEADEVCIKWSTSPKFVKFLESYSNYTFVFDPYSYEDIYMIIEVKKANPNLKIKVIVDYFVPTNLITELKEFDIPVFIQEMAGTWGQLYEMISLGMSEVYIGGDLAFQLDKVAKVLKPLGIKVRCMGNILEKGTGIDPLKSFFIRPNDVNLYEQYIDIIEISSSTADKSAVILDAYKKQDWFGNLSEIIPGVDVDNRCLTSLTGLRKTVCGRSCLYGGPCHVCEEACAMSELLNKENMILESIIKLDKE